MVHAADSLLYSSAKKKKDSLLYFNLYGSEEKWTIGWFRWKKSDAFLSEQRWATSYVINYMVFFALRCDGFFGLCWFSYSLAIPRSDQPRSLPSHAHIMSGMRLERCWSWPAPTMLAVMDIDRNAMEATGVAASSQLWMWPDDAFKHADQIMCAVRSYSYQRQPSFFEP